jgi:hypothetical protein
MTTKKITTTVVAVILSLSFLSPVALASEVTGTLSSGGVATQTQSSGQEEGQGQQQGSGAGGTITGTVVGGTNTTTTSGSGRTNGGNGTTTSGGSSQTGSVLGAQTMFTDGGAVAASPSPLLGGKNGTVMTDDEANGSTFFGGDLAEAGFAQNSLASNVPISAAAGKVPVGPKIGWGLFVGALLVFTGYGFYRRYGPRNKRFVATAGPQH